MEDDWACCHGLGRNQIRHRRSLLTSYHSSHPSICSSKYRGAAIKMSDLDDSDLSIPIQVGSRRLSTRPPAVSYSSQRRGNRRAPAGIGGDVVKSMKKGIRTHSTDQTKREARIRLLCRSSCLTVAARQGLTGCLGTFAGGMFCVLTAIWIHRLYGHWSEWQRS